MFTVEVDNYEQWHQQARALLQRGVAPADVSWQSSTQAVLTLWKDADELLALPVRHSQLRIPRRFFRLARHVACCRDVKRWPLLYSVAWRLLFENRNLLDLKIDEQVVRLASMQKSVLRDKHKMEAFVRFRRVSRPPLPSGNNSQALAEADEYFVAWFKPQHLILESVAPFFRKRFANMRWSILTPDGCVHWDLQRLKYSAGVAQSPHREDQLEVLWLEYYKHIFNPARLKLKAMQAEMPKKYWAGLPEASLIAELTRQSQQRVDAMLGDEQERE